MPLTAFVTHSDCSRHDTGWKHPEHQGRLPALSRAVYRDMLVLHDHLLEVQAQPASVDDLRTVHTEEYVQEVRQTAEEAHRVGQPLVLSGDAVLSGASWDALLAAVGCALTATGVVLEGRARNAFCAVRPPGRGAGASSAGRFGFFNTVAIAARRLRELHGMGSILIVDWGGAEVSATSSVLSGDDSVRVLSVRQQLPVTRSGGTQGDRGERGIEVVVRAEAGGEDYSQALRVGLDAALSGFTPDFILLSAGFDALASDPVSDLRLAARDFYDLTVEVRSRADALCDGRLVSVLEGGYDPAATGLAVVQHLHGLASIDPS